MNDTHLPSPDRSQHIHDVLQTRRALTCIETKPIVNMRTVNCFVVDSSPSSIKCWRKSFFAMVICDRSSKKFLTTYRLVAPFFSIFIHALQPFTNNGAKVFHPLLDGLSGIRHKLCHETDRNISWWA